LKKYETIKVRIKTEAELLRMGKDDWQFLTVLGDGRFKFKRELPITAKCLCRQGAIGNLGGAVYCPVHHPNITAKDPK
jgi:hypothetical protein